MNLGTGSRSLNTRFATNPRARSGIVIPLGEISFAIEEGQIASCWHRWRLLRLMIFSTAFHRNRLMLCTLGLLLAVFLWGFHYKLSLYHAPDESHLASPPAKLLSDAENPVSLRAAVSDLLKSQLKLVPVPAVLLPLGTGLGRKEHSASLDALEVPTPAPPARRQLLPRPPPQA